MKVLRIVVLAALFCGTFAAAILFTRPAKPATTLVGLSAADQEKIEHAKAQRDLNAALMSFAEKLRVAAGANAIDCGVVRLADDAKSAVACSADAVQKGVPFSLAVEFSGTDTTSWVGIDQDDKNSNFRLVAMCDPWSCVSALSNPRVDRCNSISLESRSDDHPFLACHPMDERGAR